jgi:hypothetical protein
MADSLERRDARKCVKSLKELPLNEEWGAG